MLDAGLSANLAPDYILISHCHRDHQRNIPYHLYTAKPDKIKIYAPEQIIDKLQQYRESADILQHSLRFAR